MVNLESNLATMSLNDLIVLHEQVTKELSDLLPPGYFVNTNDPRIQELGYQLEIINAALSVKQNMNKAKKVADKKTYLKDLQDKNTVDPATNNIICDNLDCNKDAIITKGCIVKHFLIYVNLCDKHNETFAKWVEELKKDVKEGDKKRRGGIK